MAIATALLAAGYLAVRTAVARRRHLDLVGKTAIVTGGSRGIGLAIARELVQRGARVAICARGDQDLADAEADLTSQGGEVLAIKCDVTQADQIRNVVAQTRVHFGPIDILVNNAGIIVVGPVSHMSLADYRNAMDVMYEAPLLFMLDVLPEMRRRGGGRIVNVASFGGKIPSPHLVPYAAAKHALVGLSESLRTELVQEGIYVTTVCPGLVRSGSALRSAEFKGQHRRERLWFTTGDMTPLMSIDAGRLARRIVDAMQRGDAELITPFAAAVQSSLHGALPGIGCEIVGLINRLLPGRSPAAGGERAVRGDQMDARGLPDAVRAAEARAETKYQHGAEPPAAD
ncbi:MAG: ketoacyl reductase [Phycisphaerales bacterium]|nr:ketoacyl reductase [Phycisphaerales bacterium]